MSKANLVQRFLVVIVLAAVAAGGLALYKAGHVARETGTASKQPALSANRTRQEAPQTVPASAAKGADSAALQAVGAVTVKASGAPVAGAVVTAERETRGHADASPAHQTASGADGRYALALTPEAVLLRCAAAGYAEEVQALPQNWRGTQQVNFQLIPEVQISGRVTDKETGAPLAGVEVFAMLTPEAAGVAPPPQSGKAGVQFGTKRTATDALGRYQFKGLRGGTYGVWPKANKLGYLAGLGIAATLSLDAGEAKDGVDFALAPGGFVQGTATNAAGQPVAGATVSAIAFQGATQDAQTLFSGRLDELQAVSDASGRFRIGGLAFATLYRLRAEADGYAVASSPEFSVTQTERAATIDLALQAGATVSGRAEYPDGSPAADYALMLFPRLGKALNGVFSKPVTTQTDKEGEFVFEGVGPGDYQLQPLSGVSFTASGQASGLLPLTVAAGQDISGLVFAAPRDHASGTLSGTVLDAGNRPVAGAHIELRSTSGAGPGASTTTDDGGRFRFSDLENETFTVAAIHDSGTAVETGIPLGMDLTMHLVPATAITGLVVTAQNRPVPDCRVSLEPDSGEEDSAACPASLRGVLAGDHAASTTDAAGRFTLSSGAPGRYRVRADAQQGSGYSELLTLPADATSGPYEVRIVLSQGVDLTCRVVDSHQHPIAGAQVALVFQGSARPSANSGEAADSGQTDRQGLFTASVPIPGSYTLEAKAEGYLPAKNAIEVGHARTPDFTITLYRPGVLRGRYTLGGQPQQGVAINATSDSASQTATTGPDGTFEMAGLAPGVYAVTPISTHAPLQLAAVTAEIGEGQVTEVNLNPDSGATVSGHIQGILPNTMNLVRLQSSEAASSGAAGMASLAGQVAIRPDGDFELRGVAPGRYTLNVYSFAFDPASLAADPGAADQAIADAMKTPQISVPIAVTDTGAQVDLSLQE